MSKNIGENTSKNLSCKCSHLDRAKQSATKSLKTASKRVIQETTETTGDLIGNKTAVNISQKS